MGEFFILKPGTFRPENKADLSDYFERAPVRPDNSRLRRKDQLGHVARPGSCAVDKVSNQTRHLR